MDRFLDWWFDFVLVPIAFVILSLMCIGAVFGMAFGIVKLFQLV